MAKNQKPNGPNAVTHWTVSTIKIKRNRHTQRFAMRSQTKSYGRVSKESCKSPAHHQTITIDNCVFLWQKSIRPFKRSAAICTVQLKPEWERERQRAEWVLGELFVLMCHLLDGFTVRIGFCNAHQHCHWHFGFLILAVTCGVPIPMTWRGHQHLHSMT